MGPRISTLFLGAIGLFSLSSCKENNITQNNTNNNTYVSQLVGPSGGSISGPNGSVVIFPPNALTSNTQIGIRLVDPTAMERPPALPSSVEAVSDIFALEPHGQLFALPALIRLPHNANSDNVQLYRAAAGGTQWNAFSTSQQTTRDVTAETRTFSYWVVVRGGSRPIDPGTEIRADGGTATGPFGPPDAEASDPCSNPSPTLRDAQTTVIAFYREIDVGRRCMAGVMPDCSGNFQGMDRGRPATACYRLPVDHVMNVDTSWNALLVKIQSLNPAEIECLPPARDCLNGPCEPCPSPLPSVDLNSCGADNLCPIEPRP